MRTLRNYFRSRFDRQRAAYYREQITFYTASARTADELGLVLTAGTCRALADSYLDQLTAITA